VGSFCIQAKSVAWRCTRLHHVAPGCTEDASRGGPSGASLGVWCVLSKSHPMLRAGRVRGSATRVFTFNIRCSMLDVRCSAVRTDEQTNIEHRHRHRMSELRNCPHASPLTQTDSHSPPRLRSTDRRRWRRCRGSRRCRGRRGVGRVGTEGEGLHQANQHQPSREGSWRSTHQARWSGQSRVPVADRDGARARKKGSSARRTRREGEAVAVLSAKLE
jgi:hypothetical protein